MESFLHIAAQDLYKKLGGDLSRVAVIFPNKRAGLFFNEYLAEQSEQPIWSPAYLSISELLQSLSTLRLADPMRLIFELYSVFLQETKSTETLDDFYFWGELLISDFDDVDKNLVDADRLFRNLKELRNIMDDFEFLDKEQEQAIQQFFSNFSIEKQTVLKQKFVMMWDALGPIYKGFRQRLTDENIAYEGMLYRNAMDCIDTAKLTYDTYVFMGFNVLNKVETKLFETLRDAGKAMFYWDYDQFYTGYNKQEPCRHEAGMFIRKNMQLFPSELPPTLFDNLNKPKQVTYIAASTENAQARYLDKWAAQSSSNEEKENAVVLCNEALLLPVLHSIPEEVKNINITMGFPLAQTPAYTFIDALVELQTTGYDAKSGRFKYEAVQPVLKHPYTRKLSELAEQLEKELTQNNRFYPYPSELKRDEVLSKLFTPCQGIRDICIYLTEQLKEAAAIYRNADDTHDVFGQLYREALFKSYTTINRLLSLSNEGEVGLRTDTFKRLLHRMLGATNIPFHGEPIIGMQIMGVLETRTLDFKNLIILSLNEGLLPKGGGDASFVPYNLRKAFGMTTIEHRDAVYAYYFYRLIQRAEQVTLIHNTSSEGLNRGEASRFMLQFLVEWPHEIARQTIEAEQSPQTYPPITVQKSEEMMRNLLAFYNPNQPHRRNLSPSALNTYLDCALKFYFRYVARIKVPDEVNTEIDSATFGTIFHRAVELLYKKLTETGKLIRKEDLEAVLKSDVLIQQMVDKAFKEEFFHVADDEKPEYNGVQLINSKVIATYVKQLIRNDLRYTPFNMEDMECKVKDEVTLNTAYGEVKIGIGGTIDRLDSKEGTLRIVDYKTGGSPKVPVDIEQLFTRSKNRPGYIFQTFLYAAIKCKQQQLKVAPSLLYIHRAASDEYSPVIEMGEPRKAKYPVSDFSVYDEEFRNRLQNLLEEIFNPSVPFEQTEEDSVCGYCDFKAICGR